MATGAIHNLNKPKDAFEQLEDEEGTRQGFCHIRIQQRTGRKTITTVQGVAPEYDLKKIVRYLKKDSHRRRSETVGEVEERRRERRFESNKQSIDSDLVIQPSLQYFLAALCDLHVQPEHRSRLGLRYRDTPEVRKLVTRLRSCKFISPEGFAKCPNAIVSALREIFVDFPGGIFGDAKTAFLFSLDSSLEVMVVYVNGLLSSLPFVLRQFLFLICRALKNLAQQSSGTLNDAYTDLLMLFTPVLFPHCVNEMEQFLRATRLTLVMVDLCEQVFRPALEYEDDHFFRDVVQRLDNLQQDLNQNGCDEENDDPCSSLMDMTDSLSSSTSTSSSNSSSSAHYYQFTYVDQ